jgi:hypothetical protein
VIAGVRIGPSFRIEKLSTRAEIPALPPVFYAVSPWCEAPLIITAPFSAIIIVAFVLVEVAADNTEALMSRRPSSRCTRIRRRPPPSCRSNWWGSRRISVR